jgi:hypothetical protein
VIINLFGTARAFREPNAGRSYTFEVKAKDASAALLML